MRSTANARAACRGRPPPARRRASASTMSSAIDSHSRRIVVIPSFVKETAVPQHALLVRVGEHADRGAAKMTVGAGALVSVGGRPSSPPRRIRKLRSASSHSVGTNASSSSRRRRGTARRTTHGRITRSTSCRRNQFMGGRPIVLCRRRQSIRSSQLGDRLVDAGAVQPRLRQRSPRSAYAANVVSSSGTSHGAPQEHVVLPGEQERAPSLRGSRSWCTAARAGRPDDASAGGAGPRASPPACAR